MENGPLNQMRGDDDIRQNRGASVSP